MRTILMILMIVILIFLGYMILNLGNPEGLQRYILPDPAHDVRLLAGLGFAVFVVNFLLMRGKNGRRGGRR